MKSIEFKEIARFQYSTEANLLKSKLESEGIYVFLKDEYQIDTDPLASFAYGSVKVLVKVEDFLKAKNVIDSIEKYSISENGNLMKCPNCNAEKVNMIHSINNLKSFISFIVSFLFLSMPLYLKQKYLCESCNFEFNLDSKK